MRRLPLIPRALCGLVASAWLGAAACTLSPQGHELGRDPSLPLMTTLEVPGAFALCGPSGGMGCFVEVPGGSFHFGAQGHDPAAPGYDPAAQAEEDPVQHLTLRSFYVQRTEYMAEDFAFCVARGVCREDDVLASGGMATYGHPDRTTHPIVGLTFEGARRACAYMGARLPTEAEWEFVARGEEGRRFAWGDEVRCPQRTWRHPGGDAVQCPGGRPLSDSDLYRVSGRAPSGMSGNVAEWTQSPWPGKATLRVVRGGSFLDDDPMGYRAAARSPLPPHVKLPDVGVRCVRDALPQALVAQADGGPRP